METNAENGRRDLDCMWTGPGENLKDQQKKLFIECAQRRIDLAESSIIEIIHIVYCYLSVRAVVLVALGSQLHVRRLDALPESISAALFDLRTYAKCLDVALQNAGIVHAPRKGKLDSRSSLSHADGNTSAGAWRRLDTIDDLNNNIGKYTGFAADSGIFLHDHDTCDLAPFIPLVELLYNQRAELNGIDLTGLPIDREAARRAAGVDLDNLF